MSSLSDTQNDEGLVYIVDDDVSVRDPLQDLLASVGLRSMGFGSPQEFLRSSRPDVPACLVLDVRMPGLGGLDFQQQLTKSGLHLPIIFITAHGDIPMSVRAMKAGALEFLTKPFHEQDLLDAINQGIEIDRARRRAAILRTEMRERHASLSESERAVMNLVVAGRLNKQIATQLSVSEVTVKVRRAQVMRKMRADTLADLVRMAEKLVLPD